jgi:hypothetical protein
MIMYNTINFDNLVKNYEQDSKSFKITNPLLQTNAFLQFSAELLGNTKPPSPNDLGQRDLNDWFKLLPSKTYFKDEDWTPDQLVSLLKFFAKIPFTHYGGQISQTKDKYWNSSVPIFMYGQRLINDIQYDEWNTKNNAKYILPSCYLFDEENLTSNIRIIYRTTGIELFKKDSGSFVRLYTWDELLKLRSIALTETKVEKRHAAISYKCNKTWRGDPSADERSENEEENENEVSDTEFMRMQFDALPKMQRRAILQLWIFNPAIRLVKKGLFDLHNWDHVPESLDGTADSVISDTNTISDTPKGLW